MSQKLNFEEFTELLKHAYLTGAQDALDNFSMPTSDPRHKLKDFDGYMRDFVKKRNKKEVFNKTKTTL